MATVTDHFGTVAINAGTEVTVTLDPTYVYQVHHTGVDAALNDDGPSALPAYLSFASGVTATPAEEDDKYALMDGQSVEIGPGITTLYIDSIATADGILTFARKGIPTRAF
jgi:hypothetical protein